ncbi:VirB3 family type IV secretion system protein, partial [Bartonella sp. AP4SXKL]
MKEHDKLTEDTLFLACTRPAMIAGVTVEAMG